MERFIYEADDEAATARLGAALAEILPDGATVALVGTLGAGKTRLVQAIAAAAGVDRRSVVSPTFVLVQEYSGRRRIVHIDAYRLRNEDEFRDLGPDEYFEGGGLVLVEWADRVENCSAAGADRNPHRRDRSAIAAVRDSRRRPAARRRDRGVGGAVGTGKAGGTWRPKQ